MPFDRAQLFYKGAGVEGYYPRLPIQEDRSPECMEFILKLRGIASTLNNLFRNYGLSDLPIGKEMKQTADAVECTENLIEDCIFITRMKRRIK